MKKKQLAKLKKQLQPSFEQTRQQLFSTIEKTARANYGLETNVSINPKNPQEMVISLLAETKKEPKILVPLDESFTLVVKRIQRQEVGLLARFSENLVEEIAAYWLGASANTQHSDAQKETAPHPAQPASSTAPKKITGAFHEFQQAIAAYPKFDLVQSADSIQLVETTTKEPRLLATIATNAVSKFTIEPALERKYKLKLEVIPIIENFANTPLEKR